MTLPDPPYDTCTVYDDFDDGLGNPAGRGSQIVFTPSRQIIPTGDYPTMTRTALTIELDLAGHFEATLPVSDDPDFTGITTYLVEYRLRDQLGRLLSAGLQPGPVTLDIPFAFAGSRRRLGSFALTPVIPPVDPGGPGTGGAVTSVNGEVGDVILTAAKVGATTAVDAQNAALAVFQQFLTDPTTLADYHLDFVLNDDGVVRLRAILNT